MKIVKLKLSEIKPYENNPRRNDQAVDAVAESILQCGYCAPIVVDENNVILAGHTRYKAVKKLGWNEVEVAVKSGLTDEQKRKYRLLDNKTNELAAWDFDLLSEEIEGLDFEGFDFGFNLASTDEDFLDSFFTSTENETSNASTETNANKEENKPSGDYSFEPDKKKIQCPHCGEWFEV